MSVQQNLYLVISRRGETLMNRDGTVHYLPEAPQNTIIETSLEPKFRKPADREGTDYHAAYLEDEELLTLAEDLSRTNTDALITASQNGFRFYPVHKDPAGAPATPPPLPSATTFLKWSIPRTREIPR